VARTVRWTETAIQDPEEAAAQSLRIFAEPGRVVPEIDAPDIRELSIGSYRLIYQVTADRVFILAFVHGTRDLMALWQRRGGPREPSP
jgi:plasmid stabilization system protein ParE